jgi:capsular polysaccharide biosynthesis protein
MNIQLEHYKGLLMRHWWVVALTTLGTLSVSLFVSYVTKPSFETQARFLVSPGQALEDQRDMIDSLQSLDNRSTVATYAEIIGSTSILEASTEQLAIDVENQGEFQVSMSVLPEASVIELTVTGSQPQMIALLANSLGEQGIAYIRDRYSVYDISFLDRAQVPDQPTSPQPLRDAVLAAILGLGIGVVAILLWDQLGKQDIEEEEASQQPQMPETITEQ